MKKWVTIVILAILVCSVNADVKLPAIFGDNMVLQQKSNAAVWGWADKDEQIEVLGSWMKSPVTAKADKDGNWDVKIKTPAAGGPFTLTVKGKNTITLQEVLTGEVWVCSGQSNMEMSLNGINQADQEIQSADFPQIRLFTVTKNTATQAPAGLHGPVEDMQPADRRAFQRRGLLIRTRASSETQCPRRRNQYQLGRHTGRGMDQPKNIKIV